MCIEGTMEFLARFNDKRASQVCAALAGKNKQTCLTAVKHKMYNMEKDFTLYLSE
jgi:hypothetical protein